MVLYGPWENTAYPMFMHWSVSLGWLGNCNVVNQKASFLCTLYIYIYSYIVTVWYLAKCMTRRHFFRLNIFIFILHANRFYLFYYKMILFKQFHWLSCCHLGLTFRKIWYCLIKTRIDLISLSFSFNVIKQLQSFVSVNTSFYGP